MEVRVWQSFSCNNSGSYYLVARFGDPEAAQRSAAELQEFLAAHAKQVDAMWENDQDPTQEPTEAASALAAKHNFEWEGFLLWGDDQAEDDEPVVVAAGNEVVMYHSYCGGFGEAIPKYFEALGAKPDEEVDGEPSLSILFALPDDHARLVADLEGFFHQDFPEEDSYPEEWEVKPPWGEESIQSVYGDEEGFAYFNDGHTVGIHMPFNIGGLAGLKKYLASRGVKDYRLGLDQPDLERFKAIASAVCSGCGAKPLRFIEAGTDIPEDQLACKSCGGMFPLADFAS